MLKVIKSQPPPPCLETEKAKVDGDYDCGNVVERLKADFKNKCYVCEYKEPLSINIEHFLAHRGDKDKKFDWNNLFYCCAHCNSIKSHKIEFDNIINCTLTDDGEKKIKYELKPFPMEQVKITPQEQTDVILNTAKLLNDVYNGTTTQKLVESANLRSRILSEIREFQGLLVDYVKDNMTADFKSRTIDHIIGSLDPASNFTSFKRWIVKDNPYFSQEFKDYI